MRNTSTLVISFVLTTLFMATAVTVNASDDNDDNNKRQFSVSITNITRGESFTPIVVATHRGKIGLFNLGAPASDNLTIVAESGNPVPLSNELAARSNVIDVVDSGGLLAPGATITLTVDGKRAKRLSIASMLIPTNDAFFALDSVKLPKGKSSITYYSPAYDAGSEPNDELCSLIPGPFCGGEGSSPERDGEGYVHIHAGIHGIGDLNPADFNWNNPVARIVVTRIR